MGFRHLYFSRIQNALTPEEEIKHDGNDKEHAADTANRFRMPQRFATQPRRAEPAQGETKRHDIPRGLSVARISFVDNAVDIGRKADHRGAKSSAWPMVLSCNT